MPTLVLPPRFTDDSNLLRKAAIEAGWEVERLSGWRPSPELRQVDPVLYGEPLFAAAVAGMLGLALIEPPFNWLTMLADPWTKRNIRFTTLASARNEIRPMFIKPADDKWFCGKGLPIRSGVTVGGIVVGRYSGADIRACSLERGVSVFCHGTKALHACDLWSR